MKVSDSDFLLAFVAEIWDYMPKKKRFDTKIRRKFSKAMRLLDCGVVYEKA